MRGSSGLQESDARAGGQAPRLQPLGSRLHKVSPTSSHTALALQKVTQLIMYRAQLQGFPSFFFFSFFAVPQSQKHSAHPRLRLLLALLPLTQLKKAAALRVPEPCRAAEWRQGCDSIPQAGEESGFPRVRRGPGDSLTPPCYPVTEDHTNCRPSPV